MDRPRDKYDNEIDKLMSGGPIIELGFRCAEAWFTNNDTGLPKSPLFYFATPSGWQANRPDGSKCGCITQIRSAVFCDDSIKLVAWTNELTEKIGKDERLPITAYDIDSRAILEIIADYQREMDHTIRSNVGV